MLAKRKTVSGFSGHLLRGKPWRSSRRSRPTKSSADFAKYCDENCALRALLKSRSRRFLSLRTSRFSLISRYPWKGGHRERPSFGLARRRPRIIRCRIIRVRGIRIGRAITAASIIPIHRRPARTTSRSISSRAQNPFYCAPSIQRRVAWAVQNRKRRLWFPGSRQAFVAAGTFGLQRPVGRDPPRVNRVCYGAMGGLADRSEPTITSTSSATNGPDRI